MPNNLNNNAMNELIKKASEKLGTSASDLKAQIDGGKLDQIMRKMPPQQAQNFKNLLNNPQLAKRLMDSPQAKAIMQNFFK